MGILYTGRVSALVILLFTCGGVFAQKTAAPAPAPAPAGDAAAGVVWKKQVARTIDMGEKSSGADKHISDVSSEHSMMDMFVGLIRNNKILAYTNSDHNFVTRMMVADLNKMLIASRDTVLTTDAKTGKTVSKVNVKEINLDSLNKYKVLEEWTCYPATGKTEVQIIGIAPLREVYNADGTAKVLQPMFWLKFADISAILARYQQYHPNNTLSGHIWDDLFASMQK